MDNDETDENESSFTKKVTNESRIKNARLKGEKYQTRAGKIIDKK